MPTVDLFLPAEPFAEPYRHRRQRGGDPIYRARKPVRPFAAALARLAVWIERARQRDALAGLDGHMLRDIGITRAEAARECGKPFWR